jgi:alpha-amylase
MSAMPPERRIALAALLALAALACHEGTPGPTTTGGPPAPRPTLNPTYRPSGHAAAGDVFVHLFEWPWLDVATECTNVLGPAGVAAVQVSPPQEHSLTAPTFDWSERYQPVRYSIARSRSGDSAQFVAMVNACRAHGVGIYVDAVINHMTNFPSPGFGSNGSPYSKYDYPGLYTSADFHAPCTVTDYSNAANVQDCELLSLPDLNTEKASVRDTIAGYLIKLARLGVAGFRIDAAKHIQQVSLDDIFAIVDSTLRAEGRPIPYYFLEVVGGAGEALHPSDYYGEAYGSGGAADITEFTFSGIQDKFLENGGQYIAQLNPNGPPGAQFSPAAWGLMPADKAVVFLENHDTQHNDGTIGYRDGNVFRIANVFMLAQPYGYPSILSSYSFVRPQENSMGPPSDGGGWTLPVSCAVAWNAGDDQWQCEHRDPYILSMVAFRKLVAGTDQNHWWDDRGNAIAFSRGDKGFVAISREDTLVAAPVATGMPAGTYCDLLTGGLVGGACRGTSVVVDSTGTVQVRLQPVSAIAIDAATRVP